MHPTEQLADDIHHRRIEQARATPPVVRLLDGFRLYDRACVLMLAGLRNADTSVSEPVLRERLRAQLERLRKRDEAGIFQPAGMIDDE